MAKSNSSKSKILNQESAEEIAVMYRECWRNHALLIGGYAADGCGEFIPKGTQGTKEALLCEACDCHRNFHRKELIKNGLTLVGSHHFPTNCMWGERKGVGFYPLASVCPCYEVKNDLVSDEESVVYSGSQSDTTEMKASKKPKRESS